MKILIIDDDSTTINVISDILVANKFEVLKALSVKEAVGVLNKHSNVSLIICDIMMPEENGFSMLKYLKSDKVLKQIPVIMCSALNDQKLVLQSLRNGAKDYIVKPFDNEQILKKIRAVLDRGKGSVLIVDDEEGILDVVKAMVERENYLTYQALSAEEGLEVLKNNKINYLISDITMPGMSGLEFMKIVKKEYPQIKVLMMTGYTGVYKYKNITDQGADDFITKPLKNVELIQKLRAFA